MVEQCHEKRQVARSNALFVECQEVATAGGVDCIVGILHTLGDALGGYEFADVVAREEGGERFGGDMGVDGHVRRPEVVEVAVCRDYSRGSAGGEVSEVSGKTT